MLTVEWWFGSSSSWVTPLREKPDRERGFGEDIRCSLLSLQNQSNINDYVNKSLAAGIWLAKIGVFDNIGHHWYYFKSLLLCHWAKADGIQHLAGCQIKARANIQNNQCIWSWLVQNCNEPSLFLSPSPPFLLHFCFLMFIMLSLKLRCFPYNCTDCHASRVQYKHNYYR